MSRTKGHATVKGEGNRQQLAPSNKKTKKHFNNSLSRLAFASSLLQPRPEKK